MVSLVHHHAIFTGKMTALRPAPASRRQMGGVQHHATRTNTPVRRLALSRDITAAQLSGL
jgi:hypothetical protein